MEKSIDSTKSNDQNLDLILIDSLASIEDLKLILKDQKIITFDMESHDLLTKNNIIHEISDNYAQQSFDDIQKITYKLSKWYEQPQIINDILYEEINFGKLFYVEFHYFLVPIVKKFTELISIINKYGNCSIIASPSIYKLLPCFSINKKNLLGKIDNQNFLYDSFKIKVSNSLTINISTKNYQTLKNISEKIISFLFKPQTSKKQKSILLVEFDPIKYKKFLHLSTSQLHLTLFNRRRPTVWNLASFITLRKSKCGVVTPHDVLNTTLTKHMRHRISSFTKKQSVLISRNEEFFINFFQINNISLWPALKSSFLTLYEKRTSTAIAEIEIIKKIFEKYRFDAILVWSENGFNEQIIINLAKKQKIPVILLQHGLYYDSLEALEFNQINGVLPITANVIACWGESFKKSLERWGFDNEKIKVIGNPAFDDIFAIKNYLSTSEDKFVLLITSSPTKNIISDLSIATRTHYIDCITKICKTFTNLNKNLVVKLHPFTDEVDITNIVKSINPKFSVIKTGSIINLIRQCEFVVAIDISTAIIEAQILEKPVISFLVKNYNLGVPQVFVSNSVIKTNLNDFEATLNQFLQDPAIQTTQINVANRFLLDYVSNQGNASQKLIQFLQQL